MIEFFVNSFREIIQVLLVAGLALGAFLGYALIPDVVTEFTEDPIEFNNFGKMLVGGGIAFVAEVIVMGPFLILLDMRDGILAIRDNTKLIQTKLDSLQKSVDDQSMQATVTSLDNQLRAVKDTLLKQAQQERILNDNADRGTGTH